MSRLKHEPVEGWEAFAEEAILLAKLSGCRLLTGDPEMEKNPVALARYWRRLASKGLASDGGMVDWPSMRRAHTLIQGEPLEK